eukprot:EG_transcript_4171
MAFPQVAINLPHSFGPPCLPLPWFLQSPHLAPFKTASDAKTPAVPIFVGLGLPGPSAPQPAMDARRPPALPCGPPPRLNVGPCPPNPAMVRRIDDGAPRLPGPTVFVASDSRPVRHHLSLQIPGKGLTKEAPRAPPPAEVPPTGGPAFTGLGPLLDYPPPPATAATRQPQSLIVAGDLRAPHPEDPAPFTTAQLTDLLLALELYTPKSQSPSRSPSSPSSPSSTVGAEVETELPSPTSAGTPSAPPEGCAEGVHPRPWKRLRSKRHVIFYTCLTCRREFRIAAAPQPRAIGDKGPKGTPPTASATQDGAAAAVELAPAAE